MPVKDTKPVKPITEDGDDFFAVTITFKMTAADRRGYAREYGLAEGDNTHEVVKASGMPVRTDVRERLTETVWSALHEAYWLREFTTFSVSDPD